MSKRETHKRESQIMNYEDARIIAQTLIAGVTGPDGGSTVWITPEKSTGYLVGMPQYSVTPNLECEQEPLITGWVHAVAVTAPNVATLGSWLDPSNGNHDYDACDWHEHYALALTEGNARDQIAIWDVANNVPVDTIEGLDNLHK